MATSVSFGSKGTWERLLSIPSSVLLQKLIPSCMPTQRTPYVATRMLLLHGSLETRSSQSIERRRPVAHTKCNMRIFDSCRHTTKRNFSNLLLDGSISTSPACASPPMNYYSWRIIEGHTHCRSISTHFTERRPSKVWSQFVATSRRQDSGPPTRTDLNVLIYFLSSSVWPQNKLKTRSIHMVIRKRRRRRIASCQGPASKK